MKLRTIQYLFVSILLVLANQAIATIPLSERTVLLKLYMATDGDLWLNNTHWNSAAGTECSWYGVICDAEQTTVTGLILKANHLRGQLPTELSQLTYLTRSDFRYNSVYSEDLSLLDLRDVDNMPYNLLDTQTLNASTVVDGQLMDQNSSENTSYLIYGNGYFAVIKGFGLFDFAEDILVDSRIAVISVNFLGRNVFADRMLYKILSGNDDGVFSIDNNSGEIFLVKALDFEHIAQYQLEVSASDGDANYVGKITVNVSDVLENGPAGGCTFHRGAVFDPVWLLMLLGGFYQIARLK